METKFCVSITEDYRCFKKGECFDIPIFVDTVNYIVGENGSGKSTVLKRIRSERDDLKKDIKKMLNGMYSQELELAKFDPIEITGVFETFDMVFALDAIEDDPTNFINAATASGLIMGGGLRAGKLSKGEKSVMLISRFISQVEKATGITINGHRSGKRLDKKSLILVDEIDEGLDLEKMFTFDKMLKNMCNVFNATVVCVCHNPFVCFGSPLGKHCPVFNIEKRKLTSIREYVEEKTGYSFNLTKIENEKKEQNN